MYNTWHECKARETASRNGPQDGQREGLHFGAAAAKFSADGKVQHETLGNLTRLPPDVIEFIKRRLAGELEADAPHSSFEITRSLPHGNVAAVLQQLAA
ncbi:MAG: hypothetical protein R3C28_17315 [Pirellulaceae bacterium]